MGGDPRMALDILVEHFPGAVCRTLPDEAGTMVFVSEGIETLLGYPASDFLGKSPARTFASILHPDDRKSALAETRAAVEAGRPYHSEYRIIDRDGSVRWILARGGAHRDPAGEVLHVDATLLDITDRKEMEEKLGCAMEEVEAATRSEAEFLAQMSHELRSPLNAILGFVDLVIRDPALAADHRERLGIVDRSGKHLLDLVDQILSLSRLDAGAVELRIDEFDLVEALEDVVQMARARAVKKGLRFSLELDPAIASSIAGDEGKIRQVLSNLLGNAVRYTEAGGVWLRARTTGSEDDPSTLTLELDVADTGPGIPADHLERIFQRFVRGDRARESDSGVGLGLTITKSLVDVMGGKIAAASEPGRGSLFKVRIPVRAGKPASSPMQPPADLRRLEPGQPEWRILVVEDGAENRLLLTTLLHGAGFSVREAENGKAALEIAREWKPHLVWTDLEMRIMDGYEAARAIRRLPDGDSVKIVAVSAGARMVARSTVIDAGCDELVSKPYRADAIFDTMSRLLGVRYRRGPTERASVAASSVALSSEMLTDLPPELLGRLREAALRLDREAMGEVIAAIEPRSPMTARGLSSLIRRFRMGRILELLGEKEGDA